ncbi:receptor-interacting serine/threonine-protein kinase 1 isoform X1 [Hypanus sabinus]|uniref:receptor-interacting serine/threonine-protein kinase 1 isoform X1 n=2 Tax=Hypanus sabinus TaxID=79690 RepID=UPI0028C44360|nr:receptor-interacting serine/threonine-protein kinase 1 isoform X1 [Hypanus sabinus]XP_059801621.1 receptor-interacting serine/threonine-protein kinase 1 isoform X1 [Hypanus sabinus]XP_059801622.1 receptor-interacting serine/threonine-protein kinase 1 isoform X1 [Hypanus sabinus]XP_059801624.1 receptor-interacting serine/threonine-protein kinase 1 isoform X1 [Hypanus sabinus]XP_059801625.1 receptor-interacting serine/threonine-protein kinase 1 isoform X1 [Hypanus sabinus]
MSLDDIHIDSKELIEKQPMGGGGFGMVSLCHRKNHGLVVLKTVYTGPQRMEYNGSLLEEGKMMHKLNHDRVIKLIGVILEDGNYSLVMEFMENGNLLQLLMSVAIPLSVKGRIILEILEGMAYLHEMNIVHKDLKPENILVDADYHIKIADLGVSIFRTWSRLTTEELKRRRQMGSKLQNNAGTLAYLAPEHLQSLNTKATEKSDVYSFSIVVWVILTNKEPYENALNDAQVMHLVLKGDRPDQNLIPEGSPKEMISLMENCWANKPEERPTFTECNQEFKPFYEENLQKDIDEDVEKLRELSQTRPTAPRELVKRMKSLQADCVGLMPDTPPKDDPNSLHSSQGITATGNSLEASFSSCKLSEPVEYDLDSSAWDNERDDDTQVRRKLAEEMSYHLTGSRLDASMSSNKFEEIRKERNKRVSNEPVFGSSYPSVILPRATGMAELGPSEDLYCSQDSNAYQVQQNVKNSLATVINPVKEETNFHGSSKISSPGFSDYRASTQRTSGPVPVTETGSPAEQKMWNQYLQEVSRTQSESRTYSENILWNPNSQFEHRDESNLKYLSQEGSSSIYLSKAEGVQIGDNNTMYIETPKFNRKKQQKFKFSMETANARHPDTLTNKPVEEAHLDLLRGELGKDWKHCARKLGFRESEIDEIDHDYERDGLKEKVYKMLHKWQMKEGSKGATVQKLVQALHGCDRSDLTIRLQNCS